MDGDYIPPTDAAFGIWYANFAAKFAQYAIAFGFVAADVTAVQNDAAMVVFCLNAVEAYKTESKERVDYKKKMFTASLGAPAIALPIAPTIAPPAIVPTPGIVARARAIAARIKSNPVYSEAVGKDLGIVGGTGGGGILPVTGIKPTLNAVVSGDDILVSFVKNGYQGILLETQRGAETGWTLIANLRYSPYRDTRPNVVVGIAEARRYRGTYIKRDMAVGDKSDIVTVTIV